MSNLTSITGAEHKTRTCLQFYDPINEDSDDGMKFNESLIMG